MDKSLCNVLLILFFLLFLTFDVEAQREWVYVGARPVGMGSAFLSIADDGNAVYWNPAGLTRIYDIHLNYSQANFSEIGIKSYYFSFISRLPRFKSLSFFSNNLTFGLDWLGIQAGDEKIGFKSGQLHFALGLKPPECIPFLRDFSFGMSVQIMKDEKKHSGIMKGGTSEYGWNIGVLYPVHKLINIPGQLDVGLMLHDDYETPGIQDTGINGIIMHHKIRLGISYQPFNLTLGNFHSPLFAVEFGEKLHIGGEIWYSFMDRFKIAVRGGFQKDLHTDEKMISAFGVVAIYNFDFLNVKEIMTNLAWTGSSDEDVSKHKNLSVVLKRVTPPPPVPPKGPTNCRITEVCFDKIKLEWKDVSDDEHGYIIERSPTGLEGSYKNLKSLSWNTESYIDENLTDGKPYFYRIYAYKKPDIRSVYCSVNTTTHDITWMCDINIKHLNKTIKLTFGQAPNAKNGLDDKLCEKKIEKPPQSGKFDVRFVLPEKPWGSIQSLIDLRSDALNNVAWTICPQLISGDTELEWKFSNLPKESVIWLKNKTKTGQLGNIVNVNMKSDPKNYYKIKTTNIDTLKIFIEILEESVSIQKKREIKFDSFTVEDLTKDTHSFFLNSATLNAKKIYLHTQNSFDFVTHRKK